MFGQHRAHGRILEAIAELGYRLVADGLCPRDLLGGARQRRQVLLVVGHEELSQVIDARGHGITRRAARGVGILSSTWSCLT
ncbi:hypothetical protein ADL03_15195 [Nocardia sp. NRRL S-836]|nr:hypothetical protein ADL03_15195 [Nocardia sp. NRRL S-836]